MLKFDGHKIYLTRGDTAEIPVSITGSQGAYQLAEGDVIKLTIKKEIAGDVILQKTAVNSVINIGHSDTLAMDAGEYVYDLQLRTATGKVVTVIPPSRFVLGEVVNDEE